MMNKTALDWSPDGRFLLYRSADPKTGMDLSRAIPRICWASRISGYTRSRMKPAKAGGVAKTPDFDAIALWTPHGHWGGTMPAPVSANAAICLDASGVNRSRSRNAIACRAESGFAAM